MFTVTVGDIVYSQVLAESAERADAIARRWYSVERQTLEIPPSIVIPSRPNPEHVPPGWVTAKQIAQALGIGYGALRMRLSRKKSDGLNLNCVKVGQVVYYEPSQIEELKG